MKPGLLRLVRWTALGAAALLAVLCTVAAGLWWWAGQEGSLAWALQQAARSQPLQAEAVSGSLRAGGRVGRLVWQQDGLRLEADELVLQWQPLALAQRRLVVDRVQASALRVTDGRPASTTPLQAPQSLALPLQVRVAALELGRLSVQGASPLEASGIAGSYLFDGQVHQVNLQSLRLARGAYSGQASLQAAAPLALRARLTGRVDQAVPGSATRLTLTLQARADGPLHDFEAALDLRAGEGVSGAASLPSASATARVTPFAAMPVPRAAVSFQQIDLAALWPQAPHTLLGGQAGVQPAGPAAWQMEAELRNGRAGPWDQNLLPVEQAQARLQWRGGQVLVQSLRAQAAGGRLTGSGGWQGAAGWTFQGRVDGVDPARLHGQLAAAPLSGGIGLQGQGAAVDFDLALQAGAGALRPDRLVLQEATARGRWEGDVLALALVRVRTSDAALEGALDARWTSRSGSGQLQLKAPGLQGSVRGQLGRRQGQGTVEVQATDIARALPWLRRWPGVAPLLAGVPALRGQGGAQLAWQGGWEDPVVQGRLQVASLAVVPAAADDAAAPPWMLREAELRLDGRLRDASVTLRAMAASGPRQVGLSAAGRLARGPAAQAPWQGQLDSLALQARDPALAAEPWRLQLQRAVQARWTGTAFELAAGEALLRAPALRGGVAAADAVLAWSPVRHEGGVLTTSGRVSGLPLGWLVLAGGPQLATAGVAGDMVFDAQWNAQLGASLRLDASLARARGDVNVLAEAADGTATRVSAGVRTARLTLASQGEQVQLALLWDSERAGRAEGEVRTQLAPQADGGWSWPGQAPVTGRLQAQLPRIGVWSLLAPPGWRLRGSLAADVALAGTRAQPALSGTLQADDLALRSVVDGIELRQGRLRARFEGQTLVVSEFLLRGSDEGAAVGSGGTLLAQGEGGWSAQGLQLQARAQLSQLRASVRADRQLTLSGPLAARLDAKGTHITGDLVIDRARIQLPDETPPRLGDDVQVRHAPGLPATVAERRARPPPAEAGRAVTLKVSLGLGSDFRLAGRGVDTRLAGALDIEGRSLAAPRVTGVITTQGGTYAGYDQRMSIERGELRFAGPADNPALDILAIRPNLAQRVGVRITGRAQSPHVDLYSEAGLSEAETLSWLVLGRPSAGGGAEAALLQRAAGALLAGRGGTGIARRLGLDDVGVRSDGASGTVVRVGKRFADNFYAAYERSLSGAMGTLYVFYDLSRRTTVRAEAGERAGVDLIFTFSFDGPAR